VGPECQENDDGMSEKEFACNGKDIPTNRKKRFEKKKKYSETLFELRLF